MKRTYKIQTFNDPKTGRERIGLFKRATWRGEGHGMGWYGAEYYVFAKIIAFVPKGENKIIRERKSYRKVSIVSIMAEECIKAISDEDAIQKFQQYLNEKDR